MPDVKDLRIAVIATDAVEEPEIVEPVKALRDAGAKVDTLSLEKGDIQCFRHLDKGIKLQAFRSVKESSPDDYDALLLPGGALSADALRVDKSVKSFVTAFDVAKKPIAFICHAPWILISACLVKDRTLTSYHTRSRMTYGTPAGTMWTTKLPAISTGSQAASLPTFRCSYEKCSRPSASFLPMHFRWKRFKSGHARFLPWLIPEGSSSRRAHFRPDCRVLRQSM